MITPTKPATLSLSRLIQARRIAAGVVEEHGDWALPLFERLDREVQEREHLIARLQLARADQTEISNSRKLSPATR